MEELFIYVFGLFIVIAVFFALRGLFLWYWNITGIVKNQKKQIELLEKIIEKLDS